MNKQIITYIFLIVMGFFINVRISRAQSWTVNTTNKYLYSFPADTKIGIGTSAPQERLHVVSGSIKIGQWYSDECRKNSLLKFGKDNIIQIGEWEGVNTLSFQANKYSFTKGDVNIGGNVGIRTSYPRYSLDVNGVLRTSGNALIGGNIGIRNTNPVYPLDVNGTIRLRMEKNIGGWGYSHFYWDIHTLVMGTTPGTIAHCDIALQPGGGDIEYIDEYGSELFSRFQMYSARSKTNKTLRVELCTESHCWFNNKGNVGIKTTNPQYALDVNGDIRAHGIWVTTAGADFVFDKDYELPGLEEVQAYIKTNNHLPGVESAEEMQRNGVQVSDLVTTLLQKIEELTLYTIQQEKEINQLKQIVEDLKEK